MVLLSVFNMPLTTLCSSAFGVIIHSYSKRVVQYLLYLFIHSLGGHWHLRKLITVLWGKLYTIPKQGCQCYWFYILMLLFSDTVVIFICKRKGKMLYPAIHVLADLNHHISESGHLLCCKLTSSFRERSVWHVLGMVNTHVWYH